MASEAEGKLLVPVWVDEGIVKPLVNDSGQIPIAEQSPLTNIQARLYAYDGNDWLPLRTDADKNIFAVIAGQEYDLAVGCADADDLFTGNHNYYGTDWTKQPILKGYTDRWTEWLGGTKSGAGTYSSISTAVPAGYVFTLEGVFVANDTGVRGVTQVKVADGVYWYTLKSETPSGASVPVLCLPNFTLKEGDTVRVTMASCLDNDVISAGLWGYKTDLAM